jgi:vacuolar-type H+-ATPase subunit D/Vma8
MAARVLGVLVALGVLTACVPSAPSAESWREDARQAVSDVAGELATTQLALEQESADRLVGAYAVVVVVEAEELAGAAVSGFESEQPPKSEQRRYDAVTKALDRAAGLITDARIAVADGDEAAYDELVRQLDRAGRRLDRLERALEHPPGGSR